MHYLYVTTETNIVIVFKCLDVELLLEATFFVGKHIQYYVDFWHDNQLQFCRNSWKAFGVLAYIMESQITLSEKLVLDVFKQK